MIQQNRGSFNFKELSYLQSFLIVGSLIAIGFFLQFFVGAVNVTILKFPVNLIMLLLIIVLIVTGHFKHKNNSFVVWLSSAKAAISSIVGFSVISLLMGFVTQEESNNKLVQNFGLNNIAYNWAYIFSLFILIITLGFATIKRIYPFKKRNFWYILNHLGLWITLTAANFGFPDQTHLRMNVSTSQFNNYAYNEHGSVFGLPFEIKQTDFKLINYNPKIAIMDSETSMNNINKSTNTVEVTENNSKRLKDWSILTTKYYPSAIKVGNNVISLDTVGSAPAAFVQVENIITNEKTQGWICSGNELFDKTSISLDASHTLVMLFPQQKEMSLGIEIVENEVSKLKTISINSPQNYDGWKMYIFSFSDKKGKWSNTSTIELIKEPWQPFVFFGLGMLIIGSFFVFWRGKK
jgi:regulator of RNase E activity RraB